MQALVGFTSDIVHLDNRILRLERKDVVSPETVWKIPHEGMPIRKGGSNGDLLVRFVIKFPSEREELDASLKEAIAMILPG